MVKLSAASNTMSQHPPTTADVVHTCAARPAKKLAHPPGRIITHCNEDIPDIHKRPRVWKSKAAGRPQSICPLRESLCRETRRGQRVLAERQVFPLMYPQKNPKFHQQTVIYHRLFNPGSLSPTSTSGSLLCDYARFPNHMENTTRKRLLTISSSMLKTGFGPSCSHPSYLQHLIPSNHHSTLIPMPLQTPPQRMGSLESEAGLQTGW